MRFFTETLTARASFFDRASGAADGKFNINSHTIRSTMVPLPPLSEQREIVSQLAAVEAKIDVEEVRLEALRALLRSLFKQLITGATRLPEFGSTS
jgi:restriction endonuclease S subunit